MENYGNEHIILVICVCILWKNNLILFLNGLYYVKQTPQALSAAEQKTKEFYPSFMCESQVPAISS